MRAHEDVAKLVAALVRQIPDKAKDMIPQHLSNTLWAAVQLKDVAPEVKEIVPAIVAQIPDKANGMKPQELSNSLWAAAKLKDIAPEREGDSAGRFGPDPRQGKWHDTTRPLQQSLGSNPF